MRSQLRFMQRSVAVQLTEACPNSHVTCRISHSTPPRRTLMPSRVMAIALAVVVMTLFTRSAPHAQPQTTGLFLYDSAAWNGYNLFTPSASRNTYLIDMYGRLIHSWETDYRPAFTAYLLDNGDLLRTGKMTGGGGLGGRIQKFTWEGELIWDYVYFTSSVLQHHDIEPLPNGNVLILAWENKSETEVIAAGRNPAFVPTGGLSPEHIVEVAPTGPTTGDIVWEWHLWDHLVQDFDSTKANYGVVEEHPELVDLNFTPSTSSDWIHANSIDYNPEFDQIVISSRTFNEIWIIDHSTTSAEAAGHSGGDALMGGDILYRWGNPIAYRAGDQFDQKLFGQHDARWVPNGLPGAGNILVFNNGGGRPDGDYSSVDEITTTITIDGRYPQPRSGQPHKPDTLTWSYMADPPTDWFAINISGAHRLPNGNTFICSGPDGVFFEVTPDTQTVWRYVNPFVRAFRCTRLDPDHPGLAGRDLTPGGPLESYPITIAGTAHSPQTPASYDSVVVTSTISSDNLITAVTLYADLGAGYTSLSMRDDGNHHDGAADDGVYGVSIPPLGTSGTVPYYIQAQDDISSSVDDPPNPPSTVYTYDVTYSAPQVVINEVLASNSACCADNQGDFDSWIELYNPQPVAVDLSGLFLTNDLADSSRFMIGDTTVPAGGHILFWADNETGEGQTHTNFTLNPTAGAIGLFDRNANGNALLDSITYTGQTPDTSYGRSIDGDTMWTLFANPSPEAFNGACSCPHQADMNDDDQLDAVDLNAIIQALFFNGADPQDLQCPNPRSDFDCSGETDAVDLNALISTLFFNGSGPCDPCLE
ncbi:MAG: hypothetical protein GF341_13645 [candidate division Zixibacteria bacterium]|nr:hypothetical protein [candidate division Zixibacteria bacterium]